MRPSSWAHFLWAFVNDCPARVATLPVPAHHFLIAGDACSCFAKTFLGSVNTFSAAGKAFFLLVNAFLNVAYPCTLSVKTFLSLVKTFPGIGKTKLPAVNACMTLENDGSCFE